MRIVSSNSAFSSSTSSIHTRNVSEHLRVWNRTSEYDYSEDDGTVSRSKKNFPLEDTVEITEDALSQAAKSIVKTAPDKTLFDITDEEFIGDLKSRIIKSIVETMTGKKIKTLNLDDSNTTNTTSMNASSSEGTETPAQQTKGWGIDYSYDETIYTKESVSFSASGQVTTADGKNIGFNVALEMNRETYENITMSLKAGDALIDPLIIDLSGNGIAFSDATFEFDLDADGSMETISSLTNGAAFLSMDRNGNGVIDDGSELFGPQSGNGFSELAMLDDDGNGWIDENDASFSKLKLWRKNGDSIESSTSLQENDIGAISTGKASTEFSLFNTKNSHAGILRETGIYLRESGGAGFVGEVDLVV